ncbi:MAG: HlyD family secretion protein [Reyranellaceae bacterium]
MLNKKWKWLIGGAVLVAALAGGALAFSSGGEPPAKYRTVKIERGPITSVITATGTVNPVTTVVVGSQLSGQIVELKADFNTRVKAGQELARIDTELIEAQLQSARADLASAEAAVTMQRAQIEKAAADIENLKATLATAESEARRRDGLAKSGAGSTAEAEKALYAAVSARAAMRASEASLKIAQAQLDTLKANVLQRRAAVAQVEVNLKRSVIRAPIDGVVVGRSIDVGQTVAASLQAPTLFTVAQDLRNMQVETTVDEADIGRVRDGQAVTFTVNAYPNDRFRGKVAQVRLAPNNIQNVITYTVVIAADNPDLKLLPGMTATVTIITDRRDDVLKVANAALRWKPPGRAPARSQPGSDEPPQPTTSGGTPRGANPRASADAMKKALTEQLELSADQQKELDRIFAQSGSEIRAVFQSGAAPEERRAKVRAIREAAATQIAAMLDAEQKTKYAAIRAAAAGAPPAELFVIGPDGLAAPVRVRLGVGDGSNTEIITTQLKAGTEVIVGGGPRAAAAGSSGPPRLRF